MRLGAQTAAAVREGSPPDCQGQRIELAQSGGAHAGPHDLPPQLSVPYGAPAHAFFQFDRYRHQHYALYAWGDAEACEEHFVGSWPQQVRHVARWVAGLEQQRGNGGDPATL